MTYRDCKKCERLKDIMKFMYIYTNDRKSWKEFWLWSIYHHSQHIVSHQSRGSQDGNLGQVTGNVTLPQLDSWSPSKALEDFMKRKPLVISFGHLAARLSSSWRLNVGYEIFQIFPDVNFSNQNRRNSQTVLPRTQTWSVPQFDAPRDLETRWDNISSTLHSFNYI